MKKSSKTIYVILILLLGTTLRLYNIGYYSLWNDEAGQLLAGLAPKLSDTIEIMRTHAMAMPLDYLITRVISQYSLSEGILRLPSAIWGSLSILFFFLFVNELLAPYEHGNRITLIAVFIFSIFPIHIYYSQEMRFYAALGAFFWLVNFLILNYLRSPSTRKWLALTIISIIGIYFHPYVLISHLNGFILLIFSKQLGLLKNVRDKTRFFRRNFLMLGMAGLIALITFFMWLIIIEPSSKYSYNVLQYSDSIFSFLLKGVGWQGIPFCTDFPSIGLWEIFLMTTFVTGVLFTIINRTIHWQIYVLMICFVAQISSIVFINWFRGYWIVYRQIIHLAPILMLPVSIAINELLNRVQKLSKKLHNNKIIQYGLTVFIILLTMVFAYPRIMSYYQNGKGNAEEIVRAIISQNTFDETLLVIPGFETKIYDVYFKYYYQKDNISLSSTTLDDLKAYKNSTDEIYLVLPTKNYNQDEIIAYGYEPVLIPDDVCSGLRVLYRKTNN